MKQLHGAARADAGVSIEDCLAFLAALDAYPSWYPDVVRDVEVVESGDDGLPLRAETKLHLSYGPVSRDLDLLLAVRVRRPGLVELKQVPRGPSSGASFEATWRLDERGGTGTHLGLELDATMPVPRLVPLAGVGDAFAGGFMQAAIARLEAAS